MPMPDTPRPPNIRPAHDAEDDPKLKRHPDNKDAKLDVANDESFPASDPPSITQPVKGKNPSPATGSGEE